MIKTIIKWSNKEHSESTRLAASLPAGLLFAGLIPWVLLRGFTRLDSLLMFPSLHLGWVGVVIGSILILVGAPIAV